jgi:uncharacterized radical SAM protein YgiQ
MFLPTTAEELKALHWNKLDIIIVSGDAYIDSSYDGAALIGKLLTEKGWKVGIISQPDINSDIDITRLGEPRLFWGVTAGCVDSMVANYTAMKKRKRKDDLTPGEENTKRPDRATIAYTNLIRKNYKNSVPIILGGIEASLRRIAHYDYWNDKVRRSVLFDSKADAIVYGMGEKAVLDIANKISEGLEWKDTKGICYASVEFPSEYHILPSFDDVAQSKEKFIEMFEKFYQNNDPYSAVGLVQKHDNRYLIQNPPQFLPNEDELNEIYELGYERDAHPFYKAQGKIKALETIQFSITSHRGCYGECNFCSISVHQGRRIVSRSMDSIYYEALEITKHKDFKGYISDVGGPTANMYGSGCKVRQDKELCNDKSCTFPNVCKALMNNHNDHNVLLNKVRKIPGIKKVFVGSGIRYDLIVEDKKSGEKYLRDIIEHHISGQMKIAPEHTSPKVLDAMGKNEKYLIEFKKKFDMINKEIGKKQFLTYYFIAAHPGCSEEEMQDLSGFLKKELKMNPEQVQIFTPTPSTYSTLMYYTGYNPLTKSKIFVEKDLNKKSKQKEIITGKVNQKYSKGKPNLLRNDKNFNEYVDNF